MHDTVQAPCEVPSKRERENPGRKPSARTTRLGDSKKVAFRTTVPRQRSSRLLKDKTPRPACAVPTPVTKLDKKNTFLVFSPPKFGSACRIEATFLPVRFANAGNMFALKLPTTKRTTLLLSRNW